MLQKLVTVGFRFNSSLPLFSKGWLIYLFSIVPFAADAELTPVLRLGAGACAGIIAMSATYPMDMVRGRLTVQVVLRRFCSW